MKTYKYLIEVDEWNDEYFEALRDDPLGMKESLREEIGECLNSHWFNGMVDDGVIRIKALTTDEELMYYI